MPMDMKAMFEGALHDAGSSGASLQPLLGVAAEGHTQVISHMPQPIKRSLSSHLAVAGADPFSHRGHMAPAYCRGQQGGAKMPDHSQEDVPEQRHQTLARKKGSLASTAAMGGEQLW